MKKIFCAAAVAVAIMGLASCHHQNLEGVWTGIPTQLDVSDTYSATSQITLEVMPSEGNAATGQVVIRSFVDMQQASAPVLTGQVGDQIAYALSVAATASMTGTYTTRDGGEEMLIVLDPNSLTIGVDPDAVRFTSDFEGAGQDPQQDALRPQAAQMFQNMLRPAITKEFFKYQDIDDIHVDKSIMTCEVADRDYTFHRNQ